jgi:Zn/Cd-binding protein ZinT
MVEGDNVPKLSSKCPIEIEKDTEIEKEKEIKKKKSPVYFPDDEELEAVFQDYLKLRKKIKAVNSERAINLLGNKLNKMASPNGYFDREIAIQLLNQSIENSWKTIYPLKENKRSNDVLGAIKEYAAERSMNDSRRMYEDARIPQNGLPASNEFFDF